MTGDYLWDRTGWPDPEIVRLERVLGTLRYQPGPSASWGSVTAPASAARKTPPLSFLGTLVATAAAVVALVVVSWHQSTVPVPSLAVTRLDGTPTIARQPMAERSQLLTGRRLDTDASSRAIVDITNVGRIEVKPDTTLGLLSTKPGDHRLQLSRGTLQAVIWAPPGQVSVKTPSSTAVDLGCIYSMSVDDAGVGIVRVALGWVGFEWRGRESFIPAGAACVTRPGLGPGTPYNEDTSDAFRTALTMLDLRTATASARSGALDLVLREARPEDAFTLWHLLTRVDLDRRDRVYDRLASFVPPPAGVTRDGVRAGKREMLDQWWNALDLGTAAWWRIWMQQWRDNPAR